MIQASIFVLAGATCVAQANSVGSACNEVRDSRRRRSTAASSIAISSALNDISAALAPHRFNVMAQKVSELCAELKSLGAALLSALEKRDAEALTLLPSTHEIKVLNAIRQLREKQIENAEESLESSKGSRHLAEICYNYYANVALMNASERAHLDLMGVGLTLQAVQAMTDYLGTALSLIPDFKVGSPTTVGAALGESNLGGAVKALVGYQRHADGRT